MYLCIVPIAVLLFCTIDSARKVEYSKQCLKYCLKGSSIIEAEKRISEKMRKREKRGTTGERSEGTSERVEKNICSVK